MLPLRPPAIHQPHSKAKAEPAVTNSATNSDPGLLILLFSSGFYAATALSSASACDDRKNVQKPRIATYLSYKYETLETVYGRVGHLVESPEELEKVLTTRSR